MARYFVYPFGTNADDLTEVPTSATVDNSVSYQAGFTPDYEVDDPTAVNYKPVPRGQTNQLFYDITTAIQQYQQFGVPEWITSDDNLGTAYPYSINAHVRYNDEIYESTKNNNTSVPSSNNGDWIQISGLQNRIPVGSTIMWFTSGAPTGRWLICDGSSYNRVDYPALFNVLCPSVGCTITAGSTTVSGIFSTADIFAGMVIENTACFPAGTYVVSVVNNTTITISATPTSSGVAARFMQYGSPTQYTNTSIFVMPNTAGKTLAGSGGSGITIGSTTLNKVGQNGGNQNQTIALNQIPDHSHNALTGQYIYTGSGGEIFHASSSYNSPVVFRNTSGTVTGHAGTQDPLSIIQPTLIVKIFMRY